MNLVGDKIVFLGVCCGADAAPIGVQAGTDESPLVGVVEGAEEVQVTDTVGFITSSLFLVVGIFPERGEEYELVQLT